MRSIPMSLLAVGLLFASPALAQSACAPEFHAGATRAAEAAQAQSVADAQAVNDYYKNIKNGPGDASDKLLSCVDVSWPDLPFSGMLPVVEQFIKEVGDDAVAQGCREMRNRVRQADSIFSTDNLTRQVLSGLPEGAAPYAGRVIDGARQGQPPNPLQPRPNPSAPPASGGGIMDLIKPKPNPGQGGGQVQP